MENLDCIGKAFRQIFPRRDVSIADNMTKMVHKLKDGLGVETLDYRTVGMVLT